MNIKEEIKTIIDDYSFAKDEARVRNNIIRTYKGTIGSRREPLELCTTPYFT